MDIQWVSQGWSWLKGSEAAAVGFILTAIGVLWGFYAFYKSKSDTASSGSINQGNNGIAINDLKVGKGNIHIGHGSSTKRP